MWFLVGREWLEGGAIDFGRGEYGLKGAGCSERTPFGLAGAALFFTWTANALEERSATHGACGAARCKIGGLKASLGMLWRSLGVPGHPQRGIKFHPCIILQPLTETSISGGS